MRVAFRTDASIQIGYGHVMRCLTLANKLSQVGAEVIFICREFSGNLIDYIELQGFQVLKLPKLETPNIVEHAKLTHASWLGVIQKVDAEQTLERLDVTNIDWMVVDHYALDSEWETVLQQRYQSLLVIDDLADREHIADILLDQNLGHHLTDYQDLIKADCSLLLGPNYALLREEFSLFRSESLAKREHSELKTVLVNLGGVDADNVTSQVLEAVEKSNIESLERVQVVMGSSAPHLQHIEKQVADLNSRGSAHFELLVAVNNMAQLMAKADFAIGAAGSTSWERCCLGLPTIMIVIAENQRIIADHLQLNQAALIVEHPVKDKLVVELQNVTKHDLMSLSEKSALLVDGSGCQRVLDKMRELDESRV